MLQIVRYIRLMDVWYSTEVMSPTHFNLTEQIRFYIVHSAKFRCFRPRTHQHRRYCNETKEEEQIIVKSFSFVVNFQRFPKKEKAMEFKTPKLTWVSFMMKYFKYAQSIGFVLQHKRAGPERYYAISWLQKTHKMETLSKTIVQQAHLANLNVTEIRSAKNFFLSN